MNLTIIDNHFDGIGDAVIQCWVVRSAIAAGHNVKLNMRKYPEIGAMFSMDEALTVRPGERWFVDKGTGYGNWSHERAGLTRFAAWCKAYRLPEIEPVRPTYWEPEEISKWAACTWGEREAARSPAAPKVLMYPECCWPNRQWPRAYWTDLSWELWRAGVNLMVMTPDAAGGKDFPYAMYGLSLTHGAALMRRADLVLGNDSGPAHMAGTIGCPTVAVMGSTVPEVVFGHLPEVRPVAVSKERVSCVGCHFRGAPFGYRPACHHGCQALYRLTPEEVYREIMDHELSEHHRPRDREPEGRGGAEDGAAAGGGGAEDALAGVAGL